ncbi:MAG: hypothetical protein H0V51_09650, partial [Chloroflexi bacterium]|nr:hypothetical protein [Chloroflexota bacterium]
MMASDDRGLSVRGRIPRRQFLRGGLMLSGSLVAGGLLQACGQRQAPPNPPTQAPAP